MSEEEKRKSDKWNYQKAKLNGWFHYSIEIKTLKDDYENFNLREFEVKIKRQNKDLSMTDFKKIKLENGFLPLLANLIKELKMYSCYIRFNNSGLYDMKVYDFHNNTLKWREYIEGIFEKYDKKEKQYKMEIKNDRT